MYQYVLMSNNLCAGIIAPKSKKKSNYPEKIFSRQNGQNIHHLAQAMSSF